MSYEKKVKVILHGYLKDLYPHPIEMSGYSVEEILNGVTRQIKDLRPSLGDEPHFITVLNYEDELAIKRPIANDVEELHVAPALVGGKGGFFKVILGVGLIALSFAIPAAGLLGGLLTASSVFNFGVSLALGGLLEMLSPSPKIDSSGDTKSDPEASKYLGATQNTTKIGTRIPLAYGRCQVFGHYLSFDVDAKDVALK